MMATDDERREVAERLREKKAECEERGYPWMCDDLILALGYDHDYEAGDEIFDRLADLIDPDCEDGRYSVARTARPVDREALLELAEDVTEAAAMATAVDASKSAEMLAELLLDIARRIREALGVSDD